MSVTEVSVSAGPSHHRHNMSQYEWAAMGRSLGTSSSALQDARLSALLARLHNRVVMLVGDSSLRNQFMQLARVGLAIDKNTPVAKAASQRAHTGALSLFQVCAHFTCHSIQFLAQPSHFGCLLQEHNV